MDGALAMDADGVALPSATTDSGVLMEILMDDEELDAMVELAETPVAAQISHSQIIEKQAHSIAKLEKYAERAKEYKTLTKVKLKEAALRLREYRLKLETLMGEVETLKKVQQANEEKINTMEKKYGVQTVTPLEEEPAATGRGKGGRGRGQGGRGIRGRGQGAAASVDNEQKAPAVETKSIGTQAEAEVVKSYADAVTQTMEADRVETAEFGVRTQVEAKKKCTDSGVQTTISGEIQAATAPMENISAWCQTEEPTVMENNCQCGLLSGEKNSAKGVEGEQFSQVSSNRVGSRSRSAGEGDMMSAVSRKRKRSFESSSARGEQPIPSALLATVGNNDMQIRSDSGADVAVQTHAVEVNAMHVDSEADDSTQTNEINVIEEGTSLRTEEQRERAQEESKLAMSLALVQPDKGLFMTRTAVTLPPDRVEAFESTSRAEKPVDSQQIRIPSDEAVTWTQNLPAKQLVRAGSGALDAIDVAIDAELDFSDSDDEKEDGEREPAVVMAPQLTRNEVATSQAVRQCSVTVVAASREIDSEIGGSNDEESKSLEPQNRELAVTMLAHPMVNDAICSAIDDELMTSDDEEDNQRKASQAVTGARQNAVSASNDLIGAAIDEELADSSDDEDDEMSTQGATAIYVNGAAVSAAIDDELASSSDEEKAERGVPEAATSMSAVAIDSISAAIDNELASSSDEEIDSEPAVKTEAKTISDENDPIGDAIDDELMSSSDDEDIANNPISQLDVKPLSLIRDPISAAIDDELASSSDEEDAEAETDRVQGEPASENKNFVASAIDEELASSSDEIETLTPGVTATTPVVNDPIGASIDDELTNSSGDEELGNHTDEPSPPSTLDTVDPARVTDESASGLHEEKPDNPGEEAAEAKQAAGASLLMSMLSRRPETEVVTPTAVTSSIAKKYLVETVIDDELASSSDEEEPEASQIDLAAVIQVAKKSANGEAKSARSYIDEATVSSSSALPSLKPVATSRKSDSSNATADIPVVDLHEVSPSLPRFLQMKDQTVKREHLDSDAFVAEKGDESHPRESTPASRDLLVVIGKPSLSLSSSSGSSDSDSSDSGTDSDDKQSEGDFGMEYEPEVVDVDASMEGEELDSTTPQANTTQTVRDDSIVSGEKQRTKSSVRSPMKHSGDTEGAEKPPPTEASRVSDTEKQRMRSPVRPAEEHSGDSDVIEKPLSAKEPRVSDAGKQDTPAPPEQVDAQPGIASSDDDEEGEIQTSPKKRRRTLSSDTAESQSSQHKDKSSVTESSSVKRQKLQPDNSVAQNIDATASKRGNIITVDADTMSSSEMPSSLPPPAPMQPKRDPFAKPLASFQRSIERKDKKKASEEETDPAFVARTLLLLFKTSALHAYSKPILVNKLCDTLTVYYREKEISPLLLVQETCRMLQLSKVRQMMEKGGLNACFVAHQILLGIVGVPTCDQEEDTEVHIVAEKNQLAECLIYLRSLLLVGRDHLARDANLLTLSDASRSQQLQWTRLHKNPVSHDKAFLAHVCSFYARICRSIGFDEAINVLLFDLLRWNPSIKGLFFTRAIMDVAPETLRTEFDARGNQLPAQLIQSTIRHVLAVIDTQSAHKQERILGVSSLQLMHYIAEYIQDDSLLHVNAEASAYRESFAAKLWDEHIIPLANQTHANDRKDTVFEVCKSLELLTAVYMQWQMMELFPVARFYELFAGCELLESKAVVVKMVGTIAVAFAVANRIKRLKNQAAEVENSGATVTDAKYDSSSGDYVLRVCDWLQQLLTQEAAVADGAHQLEVQLVSASVCVELISESATTRERRHKMLRDVLQWFKSQPQEQQMRFPDAFLRQLRLLTLSTRPIVKTS